MALFPELPRWASARRNLLLVQGKITEADTPTIGLGAIPSGLISDPPPSSPIFRQMPFLPQPSHFILAWDRHQICWIAYPVAWFIPRGQLYKTRSNTTDNSNQQPFYGLCTSPPVKNWKILLEQSFTGHITLLMASSAFGLGRRCWHSQRRYLQCLRTLCYW